MWLLDFLVSVYQQVYDWFGNRYWEARNLVAAIPSYIQALVNLIKYYYDLAQKGVNGLINAFYQTFIVPVLLDLQSIANDAKTYAINALNQIAGFIQNVHDLIESAKQAIRDWAIAKYDAAIAFIQNGIAYLQNVVIPNLLSGLNSLLPFQAWIQAASQLLHIDDIRKIIANFDSWYKMLTLFVANPLGFILGLFWQFALLFISYMLGYALGATKSSLPPIPDWSKLNRS